MKGSGMRMSSTVMGSRPGATARLMTQASEIDPGSIELIDAEDIDVSAEQSQPATQSGLVRFLLGASLVLIAFNLRPVFSSASALLLEIRENFGTPVLPWDRIKTPLPSISSPRRLAPRKTRLFRASARKTFLGVF